MSQPYELVNKSNTGDTDNLQQSGSSTKSDNPPPKRLLGAIIGGVLAGIVSFCIIGAVICIKAKRHQTSDTHAELEGRSQLVEMENSGQRAELPGDNPPGNQGSAIELCACDDRSEDTGRLSEHESDGGKGIGTSVVGKC